MPKTTIAIVDDPVTNFKPTDVNPLDLPVGATAKWADFIRSEYYDDAGEPCSRLASPFIGRSVAFDAIDALKQACGVEVKPRPYPAGIREVLEEKGIKDDRVIFNIFAADQAAYDATSKPDDSIHIDDLKEVNQVWIARFGDLNKAPLRNGDLVFERIA